MPNQYLLIGKKNDKNKKEKSESAAFRLIRTAAEVLGPKGDEKKMVLGRID